MAVRAAMLTTSADPHRGALQGALRGALAGCAAGVEIRTVPWGGRAALSRLPFGAVLQLALYRPDLVVFEDFGAPALQAALYRLLSRRSRLLLCTAEPPRRFGLRERAILGQVDGVLADGEAVAQAVARLRFPAARVFQLSMPHDVEVFLACGARHRAGAETHRLAYAGDLSPQSGAADLLIAVASWAEGHPGQPVEIWWIGEGDLAGVLSAQPLPATVSQRFLGRLDGVATATALAQCGLFVVPSLTDDRQVPVPEALAAGLPVLGSRRSRRVRQLVREEVNGWLFDPLQPADMARALGHALGRPAEDLDWMRDQARAVVPPAGGRSFAERFRGAVAAIMPDAVPAPEPQAAP
jgi:glycosyltransferase involved in cell wall biosynthesis